MTMNEDQREIYRALDSSLPSNVIKKPKEFFYY